MQRNAKDKLGEEFALNLLRLLLVVYVRLRLRRRHVTHIVMATTC